MTPFHSPVCGKKKRWRRVEPQGWAVTAFGQTWFGRPYLAAFGQTEFGQYHIWPKLIGRIWPSSFGRIWPIFVHQIWPDRIWPTFCFGEGLKVVGEKGGGGPEGWGGGLKGGGGGGAKFRAFFPCPTENFILSARGILVVFEVPGRSNVHVGALWLSCGTPANRHHQQAPRGTCRHQQAPTGTNRQQQASTKTMTTTTTKNLAKELKYQNWPNAVWPNAVNTLKH